MNLWLCSPAHGRCAVTRLVLAERRWLCDQLALRGWQANSVIVADDENLDIALEYGFPTVELDNSDLGARFNAGYQYAADQGADILVHVGSDDWVHPDMFGVLDRVDLTGPPEFDLGDGWATWADGPTVVASRRLAVVNLASGRLQPCKARGSRGCIPWLLPREALAPDGFAPIRRGLSRGIDGALVAGMSAQTNWLVQEGSPAWWAVDFKTGENITPYRGLAASLGVGDETDAWPWLGEHYPTRLVEMAREAHEAFDKETT